MRTKRDEMYFPAFHRVELAGKYVVLQCLFRVRALVQLNSDSDADCKAGTLSNQGQIYINSDNS